MESEKEITHFDTFMCVFGVLPLSEWNQHQKPLLKAVVKRRLTLYGAVIKGRQFSKKIEHCRNEINSHQVSKSPLGFNNRKQVAMYWQ